MSGFFHWSMRHAGALLFATALVIFATGLIPFLYELGATFARKASHLGDRSSTDWGAVYQPLLGGFAGAMWPLFGAALLYRFDRREHVRATFGAGND